MKIPEKSEILQLYDGNSISVLAYHYKVARATIRKWLNFHDIPIKSHLQSSTEANSKIKQGYHNHPKLNDKEWLYNQRIINRKSYQNIGEELGVSDFCVKKYCKLHDIPLLQYNKSPYETDLKLSDKDFLESEYDKGKTLDEIAKSIGSNKATLSEWFAKHSIPTRPSNWYERKNNFLSNECNEIHEFIESLGFTVISNDRKILNGREIDLWIPEKNLAIEYNGLYHHIFRPNETSNSLIKGRNYHVSKTNDCEAQGIQLLHIFSDDWNNKKPIWKSMLSNKLGRTKNTIFARKCEIKTVQRHEKIEFLVKNHIQGKDTSTIAYGLYYEERLVSLFTAKKSRYTKGQYDWELMRFCNLIDTSVVGGFTRLLSHFIKNHPGTLVTYTNREYSNGALYEKTGFRLTRVNGPSYYHVDLNKNIKYHRSTFQKKRLLPGSTMSESDIMKRLGYQRIWNCGTKTYIFS